MRNPGGRRGAGRPPCRAGFTLVELMVYLALLVAGTLVIAGLEFTAARAAFLERALVDLGMEADELSTRFRDDVRQSLHAEDALDPKKGGALLVLAQSNGGSVRWEIESPAQIEKVGPLTRVEKGRLVRKTFAKAGTTPTRVQPFLHFERLSLTKTGAQLRLEVTLSASRGGEVTARRTYQLAATPVSEEAP